jgi:hypothetical protein
LEDRELALELCSDEKLRNEFEKLKGTSDVLTEEDENELRIAMMEEME